MVPAYTQNSCRAVDGGRNDNQQSCSAISHWVWNRQRHKSKLQGALLSPANLLLFQTMYNAVIYTDYKAVSINIYTSLPFRMLGQLLHSMWKKVLPRSKEGPWWRTLWRTFSAVYNDFSCHVGPMDGQKSLNLIALIQCCQATVAYILCSREMAIYNGTVTKWKADSGSGYKQPSQDVMSF